jgi:dipeptidyl aminopeptidase/acylaminoacyl peptidase
MRLTSALLAAPLIAAPLAAQRRPPAELERLLAAPMAQELAAAPTGGGVAWVLNERGARNVWVALPPDYRGRRLTSHVADDGQELAGLEWAPDGKALYYVRGGGANRAGESPNPASDPAGVEQAIWRVALAGGEPAKVAAGSNGTVSPRGDVVAFTRRGQIWSAPADGSKEPTQLVHARGTARALRWSPDGGRLAFVSDRGDHSFVGVYDLAAKALRWLAPAVDSDDQPAWSLDGRRLAFIRVPARTTVELFVPVRSAHPWSIMVADAASGEVRTIWQADAGDGSAFREIVADNQLFWGDGDRIVFPWEKDGWTHLYSVSAAGGRATLLTPGEFEVEYAGLTADRREVLYNSNQGDIDRRDVWRVPVGGGRAPAAVTSGPMIEWAPALLSDGRTVALLRSGPRATAHAALLAPGAREPRPLAPETVPDEWPAGSLVEPEAVVLTAADGMPLHAQLFRPRGIGAGERRPAVIFLHGGSRRQMLLGYHYGGYYHNAYAFNQYLASKGYVVLSVNFRSGIGYGMRFREALSYGAAGASEFNDVLGAGLYLKGRPDVDAARIGLWGGSYGGYLTAMGLARASDLFAAGVDVHGVHDWNVGIRTFVPSYNKLEDPERMRLAFQSSPMAHLDGWRSPVLVIHGDDDRNVSFAETVALVEKLRERRVEVEQLVFPDEVHSFLLHRNWVAAYAAAAEFFDRRLGRRQAAAATR